MADTDAPASSRASSRGPSLPSGVRGPTRAHIDSNTLRGDRWWLYPLTTFVIFMSFVVYATIRAFQGSDYYSAPYLSPFYSPCLGKCVQGSSDFGQPFQWWPLSSALIILIFPLGFRLTCYYYRKAYYRSFWLSPPACAVAEPHVTYTGETRLPLILNNIHRYFWYAAVLVALILTYDTLLTFRDPQGNWGHMGLGTLVFLVNILLIWLYTLSCHSCRHIVGGRLRHSVYAWASLFSVAIADLYVLLLATNVFDDPRFF